MNYTYRQIGLINYPVMLSILMEQLINITDAIFLGHVGEVELGASALASIYYLAVYMLGFGFSLGLQVMIARRNRQDLLSRVVFLKCAGCPSELLFLFLFTIYPEVFHSLA